MSVFGGRRASSPAQGRARTNDDAPRRDADAQAQAPHFRASQPAADPDTVEDARAIIESLRVHLEELDRREQELNDQLSLLVREQRSLRVQSQQFADEQLAQQQAIDERERDLSERETAVAELATQAADQQQAIDTQQAELDRQRADFREALWGEVAAERDENRRQRLELDRQREELEQQAAQQRTALLAELGAERHTLREQQRELEEARADFEQDQNRQREALAAELERQRAADRELLAAELADERENLQEQQQQLDQTRTDFEQQQAEFELTRSEFESARAAAQAQRDLEIAEHTALLDQIRAERLEEVQAREADVSRREVDLIKRTRFQEEHLARLRTGIETRQTELERRRAALNIWVEQVEATARGRLAHLRKYRDVLEQREHACDDAWQALADARDQQQAVLGELRRHIADEQSAFADEQRALAGDFRRHAELLQLREQDVERRATRIEQWRDELERRQHLLVAREAAVREAAEWLAERIGTDAADLLVPREDLPTVPAADLAARRAEIAGAQRQLAQWHQQLQNERESLAQMIADREERLHGREDSLRRQLEILAERESDLQQAQTRDRSEREQAFAVLESLVEQIERRLRS